MVKCQALNCCFFNFFINIFLCIFKNQSIWYSVPMDIIEKFYADIDRIKKHDRLDNGGDYDPTRTCKTICKHFAQLNKDLSPLPESIADYWFETYIIKSTNIKAEPTEKNITWLGATLCLLEGDFFHQANDTEKEALSFDDWKEICTLVNCEAEDLPIEVLSSLMSVFTEKKVL